MSAVPATGRYSLTSGVRVSSHRLWLGSAIATSFEAGMRLSPPDTSAASSPLEVGDRIEVGGQRAIVRTIEPLLGEREVRLVAMLARESS
jgi:hypothetical protein